MAAPGSSGRNSVPVERRALQFVGPLRSSSSRRFGAFQAVLEIVPPHAVCRVPVERLQRKGGREVVARCPTEDDGDAAAAWLVDRISRLQPDLAVTAEVEPGGGQFVVVLRA